MSAPIKLGDVSIAYQNGDLSTTFPDGAVVHARAHETVDYLATAKRLGYSDVETLNRDHDLVHSLLAHWLGLAHSPTLERAACGGPSNDLTNIEEDAVLAIQRLANALHLDLMHVALENQRRYHRDVAADAF